MKTALVLGAGGFIGSHMVNRLKKEGYWVRGVDIKYPEFSKTKADHFILRDLRDPINVREIIGYAGTTRDPHQIFSASFDNPFDEIYQFAADMGGAGYIFTQEHDADVMHNSATINLNILNAIVSHKNSKKPTIFYSSSACIYPEYNQLDPSNPYCAESSAYPANPDSEYGWEKLFSERLYLAYMKNYGINVKIARYHNIFGPEGTFSGGKEKAPAALCRKVIRAEETNNSIEVWGDGNQTRSFLYIDECIEGTRRLMESNFVGPVNIGSEEMVTINELIQYIQKIAKTNFFVKHIPGPVGVRGRNSDNNLIFNELNWKPSKPLLEGLEITYNWILHQIKYV